MRSIFLYFLLSISLFSCCSDDDSSFVTTPFTLENTNPLPSIPNYPNNPLTVEGIALGKKLFYEKRLSGDNTMSCNSCHKQENAFATNLTVEKGIDDIEGTRNSMPLFNFLESEIILLGRACTYLRRTNRNACRR